MSLAPWKTWLIHAVLAALTTLAFSTFLDPWTSALLGWWGWMWREVDQVAVKLLEGQRPPWFDAFMDVVAPAVSSSLIAWWR